MGDVGGSGDLDARLGASLDRKAASGRLRGRRVVRQIDSAHLEVDGKRCVNFASNNYLGLTHHPKLLAAARSVDSVGSGAAGLISGFSGEHADAEAKIARWKSTQSAVLLPSGYQANLAAVQTFAAMANGDADGGGGGVRFLLDKLCHASLVDAVRGSGLPFRIFPHNHLPKLERLLTEADAGQLQVVITESIFSMDGDAADLRGIAALKLKYRFALLLDEAHGCGVYGHDGAGLAAEMGLADLPDVSVCTLSKAAGAIGGAVCGSELFCDALLNFARAFIFSTAVPPGTALIAQAAIDVMRDEPWRQKRVRSLATKVRDRLKTVGAKFPDGDSPIIPLILGDERETLAAAAAFLERGLFVTAIRPPTVAAGTCRLRITLSCDHSDEEIEALIEQISTTRITPTITPVESAVHPT